MARLTLSDFMNVAKSYSSNYMQSEEFVQDIFETISYVLFTQGFDANDAISYFKVEDPNEIIEKYEDIKNGKLILETTTSEDYIAEQFRVLYELAPLAAVALRALPMIARVAGSRAIGAAGARAAGAVGAEATGAGMAQGGSLLGRVGKMIPGESKMDKLRYLLRMKQMMGQPGSNNSDEPTDKNDNSSSSSSNTPTFRYANLTF